jgi:hypothetical protein
MKKSVIGIVESETQAQPNAGDLQAGGVASSQISVLFPNKRRAS